MTEKEVSVMVDLVIDKIMMATKDYGSNPEKAELFIRKNCRLLYELGIEIGQEKVKEELFNGF